jgi:citrate lyase beta subunit
MSLPTFPGWELINEILIDLEDAIEENREEARLGIVNYRKNLGRKKGLKQAVVIIRSAVYDLEGV